MASLLSLPPDSLQQVIEYLDYPATIAAVNTTLRKATLSSSAACTSRLCANLTIRSLLPLWGVEVPENPSSSSFLPIIFLQLVYKVITSSRDFLAQEDKTSFNSYGDLTISTDDDLCASFLQSVSNLSLVEFFSDSKIAQSLPQKVSTATKASLIRQSLQKPSEPTKIHEFILEVNEKVRVLPVEISHLKSVEELNLSCPYVEHIPSQVGDLKKLKSLLFAAEHLRTIDPSLAKAPNLHSLFFKSTQSPKVPETIWQCLQLKNLTLDVPDLSELPGDIAALSDLETFGLTTNTALKDISPLKNLPKLRDIIICSPRLEQIPVKLIPITTYLHYDTPESSADDKSTCVREKNGWSDSSFENSLSNQ